MADDRALIVSAVLDAATFALADGLRRAHFPPARNVLAAHLTLFHALPSAELHAVSAALHDAAAGESLSLVLDAPLRLGFGTALHAQCPALEALRAALATRFAAWLTPQDRQRWRPHVTVQNKVPPAEAEALFATLSDGWQARAGTVEGLALWRYAGGPWEPAGTFAFRGRRNSPET